MRIYVQQIASPPGNFSTVISMFEFCFYSFIVYVVCVCACTRCVYEPLMDENGYKCDIIDVLSHSCFLHLPWNVVFLPAACKHLCQYEEKTHMPMLLEYILIALIHVYRDTLKVVRQMVTKDKKWLERIL